MRRIELYIKDMRADLGEDAKVLYTFALTDVTNPGIVRNSFSQQLTLPGTPANDRIFRNYFRMDAAPSGTIQASADPLRRVAFTLYADDGVILESGYARLDQSVTRGNSHSYKVTLFGALGDLLYLLDTYQDRKRTLADLDYTRAGAGPNELSFRIRATFVRQCWNRLLSGNSGTTQMEDIINFAAAYEGFPESFDASRALVQAASAGLQTEVTEEGVTYQTRSGYASVDLGGDSTGIQCRDFRSYLQRPVLSVTALFRAIGNAVNLDLDTAFFKQANPYYSKAWLTLPALNTLKVGDGKELTYGPVDRNMAGYEYGQDVTASFVIAGSEKTSGKVRATIYPKYVIPQATAGDVLYYDCGFTEPAVVIRGLFVQLIAYDTNNNIVGASKVYAAADDDPVEGARHSTETLARITSFTPAAPLEDQWGPCVYGHFEAALNEDLNRMEAIWTGPAIKLEAEVGQFSRLALKVSHAGKGGEFGNLVVTAMSLSYSRSDADPRVTSIRNVMLSGDLTYTYTEDDAVRSGTLITKSMLLGGTMSPAEFLLSYCKRFGLIMSVEPGTRTLRIMTRSTWFAEGDRDLADYSGRVCRDRELTLSPTAADKMYLRFAEPEVEAAWLKEYSKLHAIPSGVKQVVTGYEFNTETEEVLQGTSLKTTPEVMERDLTFVDLTAPVRPSVFLRGGLKYGLFSAAGEVHELPVPAVPATVTVNYWNPTYKGYDKVSRLQFHGEDGDGVEADSVLVFFTGQSSSMKGAALTDDLPEMFLAGDKPCWLLHPGGTGSLQVPLFGRHLYTDASRAEIARTMDFSLPVELDIPGVEAEPSVGVYDAFWKAYIKDRYSKGAKAVTLFLATRGMPVFQGWLRKFLWIDGALWSVAKIGPYDMAGDGVTKVELVQIQDVAAYFDYPEF